jgi:hypothetical protein
VKINLTPPRRADYDKSDLPWPTAVPPTCAACAQPAPPPFYVRRGTIVVLCLPCYEEKPP